METLPPSQPASERSSDSVERWHLTEELFHRALTYSSDQRVEQARAWCGADSTLLAQLLALIESNSSVEELIAAAPPVGPQEFLLRQESPEVGPNLAAPDPWLGRMLGPFRIESVLGRGGMGVVYLGQRVTEGFTQTVAIKVIARHLRSSPAVGQFLLERETLAKLQHPNIARLLDGGVADDIPYVVMEYIDGQRLDAVCDDLATTIETTIRLTLQLCDAVIYVHRNLILHRDLKPGNVMVTGDGIVKLLDFGTLKLMSALAADSDMTQAGMRSVTLRYASPEHIRGDAVSTASDVYSVGMLLYRLIAGHLPEGLDNLPAGKYLERLREARLRPPCADKPIPSRLAEDLDAIVMKAIRFDAKDRYPSVSAFAADLSNALQDEPVAAREGNLRYRLGKFYRHRRTAVLGAAAILIVLAVGLAAIVHQDRIARAETLRAEAGIESERKLAHLLLFDYFEQLKRIPGSTDAQHKAVSQALTYLDGLTPVTMNSNLELDRVQAYTKMGALLGSSYEENLGDMPGAVKTLQKSIVLSQMLVAHDPTNLIYLQNSVAAQKTLGQVYLGAGDPQRAVAHLIPAAEASRRIAAMPGVNSAGLAQAASVVDVLGDAYGLQGAGSLGDTSNAIERYEQAQAIDLAGLRQDTNCASCRRGVAIEDWKVGLLVEDEDKDRAAGLYRHGLATVEAFSAAERATPRMLRLDNLLRQQLAVIYIDSGRIVEGLQLIQTVQQRFQSIISLDPVNAGARSDLAILDYNLTNSYEPLGQDKAELGTAQDFLKNMEVLVRVDPTNNLWRFRRGMALLICGKLQIRLGQKMEGERLSKEGMAVVLPLAQKPDATARILGVASDYLVSFHPNPKRDYPMAIDFAQRAIKVSPHPSPDQLLTVAEAQNATGLTEDAGRSAHAAIALLSAHPGSLGNAAKLAQANQLLHR